MRRPTPLLYLSLTERDWARLSVLACPPFGDVRRLWRCRNRAVLNKSGSVGTFLRKAGGQPRDGNRLCKALVGDLSNLFVRAWLISARSNALGWGRHQSDGGNGV